MVAASSKRAVTVGSPSWSRPCATAVPAI